MRINNEKGLNSGIYNQSVLRFYFINIILSDFLLCLHFFYLYLHANINLSQFKHNRYCQEKNKI